MSLKKVYNISFNHAKRMIIKNGGTYEDDIFRIKKETPNIAPLEVSFPGYKLHQDLKLNRKITSKNDQLYSINFEGVGVVLKGAARNIDNEIDKKYALLEQSETLNNFSFNVEFKIDGQLIKKMNLPIYFIERAHELFFKYELEDKDHLLEIRVLNPNPNAYLKIESLISYKKFIQN